MENQTEQKQNIVEQSNIENNQTIAQTNDTTVTNISQDNSEQKQGVENTQNVDKEKPNGNCNVVYKYPVYIKVKEYKTGKDVIINTRRILYTVAIDNKTSMFMMNSGYKIKVNIPINDLWNRLLSKQSFKK